MKRRRSASHELNSDRLSDLPEPLLLHIPSFLPSKSSIRTSVLSRRYRNLWTASPTIDLDRDTFPAGRKFRDVTNRCFRLRDSSAPLLRLCLRTYRYPIPTKSLAKWLVSASSKGLRHLELHVDQVTVESVLPLILSFRKLETFFVENIQNLSFYPALSIVPETFEMVQLKSLHFSAHLKCSELSQIVAEQRDLEYLCYRAAVDCQNVLDLSVKVHPLLHFHVEMPRLRGAVIKFYSLSEGSGPVFIGLLRSIVNLEELDIYIEKLYPDTKKHAIPSSRRKKEQREEEYPFHPFVDPGREKDMSVFHNLKWFKLPMCFHEYSIEDLVCLLHDTRVLESLQLVHVTHTGYWNTNKSDRWISRLPLNSEGNNQHCYFADLNISGNKIELIKNLLCKEKLSMKLTTL